MEASSTENKSILIVKAQSQGLTAVENFLRNRGWKIYSTTSVKDALTHMIQNQPAFVMVTVDHANKKVRNLPRIFAQAFPCCVILFAENSAAASYKMLSDSRSEYLLYPPVTGPAVERTVNKYYKDQLAKKNAPAIAENTNAVDTTGGAAAAGTISIRGEGISAQSLLAQIMGDDNGGSFGADGKGGASGAAYRPDSSASNPPFDSGAAYGGSPSNADPTLTAYNPKHGESTTKSKSKSGTIYGGLAGPALQRGEDGDAASTLNARHQADADGFIRTKNHADSIILKGTKEALDKCALPGNFHSPAEEIIASTNVACIVIESNRFSGYLVAAMGANRRIDEAFIQRIRERLFGFLQANGESVADKDSMGINIKEVPFEDWAVECAQFLRKSVHQGDEVAMAFFPYANVTAKVEKSADEKMVAIDIEEIKMDVVVEFDLYIYLPANQKYVLYTPCGGKIYENQKHKLGRQGVKQMHMLKGDVVHFNKYRAQNYLNDKIDTYKKSKAI